MNRLPRLMAVQVGEFAVGVLVAYTAVGAVFALTQAVVPVLLVALALAAVGIAAEVRWRHKVAGLAVGMVPTALLAGSMFAAFSLVLSRAG